MASFTAVLDACVLYPAPLRDLLVRLASNGLFRARWTEEIHNEWRSALLRNRSDLSESLLQRTSDLMDLAIPNCLITGHMRLIEPLILPDPVDRHVLAAAIRGHAEVIVTFNEKDFPKEVLGEFDIETQHPDAFISHLISLDWTTVCLALKAQRASLRNPPRTPRELLDTLESQGLPLSVSQLRPLEELI